MQVKHGTNQGWIHGCRRKCCVLARHRFRRKNNLLGGRPAQVPVEEAVRVLEEILRTKHITQEEISRLSGVDERTLTRWKNGDTRRVTTYTLDKVRRVSRIRVRPPRVPAAGSQRRIQAMCYRGFSQRYQSRHTGIPVFHLSAISKGLRQTVVREEADLISQLHNSTLLLPDPEGPSAKKTRAASLRLGFLPAGVWKDIDDPDCIPDDPNPEYKDPVLQEGVERSRSLVARGFTIGEIADASGLSRPNLHKVIQGKKKEVHPETAKKIHRGCDLLEVLPDPKGGYSERARSVAQRNGWK